MGAHGEVKEAEEQRVEANQEQKAKDMEENPGIQMIDTTK